MTIDKPNFPWSFYGQAWKLFRRLSDENIETAKHLLSRDHWPNCVNTLILDVGCGDGLLIQSIIDMGKIDVGEVILIDPYIEWLDQARKNINDYVTSGVIKNLEVITGTAEDNFIEYSSRANVILGIHLAYLVEPSTIEMMIASLPTNIPFYFVLDHPSSIFSKLWEETAPVYKNRASLAHKYVRNLGSSFEVNMSTIISHLPNPLSRKDEIKDQMLSLLCYDDVRNFPHDLYAWVTEQVAKAVVDNTISCDSTCYEILKR